jgi:cell wall-associated NlpC family hydrolase
MDRRMTPATARVAHVSLRGVVEAPVFTAGEALRVNLPLVDLLRAPGGARERQLWLGDGFTVIDRDRGHAFGFAAKDGYCGWLAEAALGGGAAPTHWVASPGTHLYPEARVQSPQIAALPMGARLAVTGQSAKWAETALGFVPGPHLRALGDWHDDPVAVAEHMLHTPYLWGGNSRAGIDCSGLVQLAFLSCGLPCPGDSDLQESLGADAGGAGYQRGDLLFWRGHVALITAPTRLIHANGHTMSVAYEGIADCIARIAAQDGGPVTHHRQLETA